MSKTKNKTQETPKYDSSKAYSWENTDKIIFTGAEFNVLYQTFSKFMNSPITDVATILSLVNATNLTQAKLAEYVEKGVIREAVAIAE